MQTKRPEKIYATPGIRTSREFEINGFVDPYSLDTAEVCMARTKAEALKYFITAGTKVKKTSCLYRTTTKLYVDELIKHPPGTVLWLPSTGANRLAVCHKERKKHA